jgi:hypothetical protein
VFSSRIFHAFLLTSSDPSWAAQWFTWCQACRHGGHAGHMAEWFRTHADCPVTDCRCQCAKFVIPHADGVEPVPYRA